MFARLYPASYHGWTRVTSSALYNRTRVRLDPPPVCDPPGMAWAIHLTLNVLRGGMTFTVEYNQ